MNSASIFALLDDNAAPDRTSRLYKDWECTVHCEDPAQLDEAWSAVQAQLARGRYVVLLADYEWGAKLLLKRPAAASGRLSFLIFNMLVRVDQQQVEDFLLQQAGDADEPGVLTALHPDITPAQHAVRVQAIKEHIAAGATYQVNFTHRLRGAAYGNVINLYRRLRERQRVAHGALIRLPQSQFPYAWVLSRSPELFVEHRQGLLRAKPMKGTAPQDGPQQAAWLQQDPKNRAENLMIVDLLRNDLGRISTIGSVRVPALFSVEPYAGVWQMTSTVESRVAPSLDFPAVLRALFPCGSITGAPKIETMKIIESLEASPRGLYTGSIGWIDPCGEKDQGCPDFCLSVAIRTLLLAERGAAQYDAECGTGGGIVIDSSAQAEFDETVAKARFLSQLDPGFVLIETMRVVNRQVALLDLHLSRVTAACVELGFGRADKRADIETAVRSYLQGLDAQGGYRLRLTVNSVGQVNITHTAFVPAGPDVTLTLAQTMLRPSEAALTRYKTSYRPTYTAELKRAEALGAFDAVFVDAAGRVTEGARTSVFAKLRGRWITPRLRAGVLPGVMRSVLLQDAALQAVEGDLSVDDLRNAEALMVCNALQGALAARLVEQG